MTNSSKSNESDMLAKVRRWRREAYEADQSQTDAQRKARVQELTELFGLSISPTRRPRRRRRKN